MTTLHEPPIGVKHIQYGLGRLKAEMGIQIALPPEQMLNGLDKIEQLYDKLVEYAKRQAQGKPFSPDGDLTVQVLLQSCALVDAWSVSFASKA